jgi:hypothetical protein
MATIGQATLLVNKRFKQYDELCDLSKDKTAELSAGATDLEGFWEVILMQVGISMQRVCAAGGGGGSMSICDGVRLWLCMVSVQTTRLQLFA